MLNMQTIHLLYVLNLKPSMSLLTTFHLSLQNRRVVSAFYQGKCYDNAVILTLKPNIAVEWQTTENMSKRDLRKLHGMQPTFYNAIFHVGEIVRAYPVNQKYTVLAQLFVVLKVVTPLWSVGMRRDQTILPKAYPWVEFDNSPKMCHKPEWYIAVK